MAIVDDLVVGENILKILPKAWQKMVTINWSRPSLKPSRAVSGAVLEGLNAQQLASNWLNSDCMSFPNYGQLMIIWESSDDVSIGF